LTANLESADIQTMEALRKKKLKSYKDDNARQPLKDFTPGTFGCHEVLHMAAFLLNNVTEELCNHPAVLQDQKLFKRAHEAESALAGLYTEIKKIHAP